MIKSWEVLSSSIVYQQKWMQITEETCKLPDGRILSPYMIVHVPSFCNIFMVTEAEEIVMVQQYRHAAGIITLELPGGMVDEGEDPANAAMREMREETGYSSEDVSILYSINPNPPLENNQAWFYLAKNVVQNKSTALDAFEDIELVLIPKAVFIKKLLGHEFTHGAQLGAMYAAAIKLGWFVTQ